MVFFVNQKNRKFGAIMIELSQREIEFLKIISDEENEKGYCTQSTLYDKGHQYSTISDTTESLKTKGLIKKDETSTPIKYKLTDEGKNIFKNYTVIVKDKIPIDPPSQIDKNSKEVKITNIGRGICFIEIKNKENLTPPLIINIPKMYSQSIPESFFRMHTVSVGYLSGNPAAMINYLNETTGTLGALTLRKRII